MKPQAHQRGGATLTVALVLALLGLLSVGFVHRGLVFEQRTAANQQRASQAFEASEAGLEWALAMLNSNERVDDQCLPTDTVGANTFRERLAERAASSQAMQAACAHASKGWVCHCPSSGAATRPTAGAATAGFGLRLQADAHLSQVELQSSACIGTTASCAEGSEERPDAVTQTQVVVARIPGLGLAPSAALTVRGDADLSGSFIGIHHTRADGSGVTVHAGGAIDTGTARLSSSPGAPAQASVLDLDPKLATLNSASLFANVFRLSRTAWREQPAAVRVDCETACDQALAQAIGSGVKNPLVWLNGGLHLSQPAMFGTPQRPVLLVVDGPVRFDAPVVIHGVVYGTSSQWADSGAGTQIHGAVLIDTLFAPGGNTDIHHDADVIERLRQHAGSFARVPGSWRDF